MPHSSQAGIIRALFKQNGVTPLPAPPPVSPALYQLGCEVARAIA